jgi:hypothetical protein
MKRPPLRRISEKKMRERRKRAKTGSPCLALSLH